MIADCGAQDLTIFRAESGRKKVEGRCTKLQADGGMLKSGMSLDLLNLEIIRLGIKLHVAWTDRVEGEPSYNTCLISTKTPLFKVWRCCFSLSNYENYWQVNCVRTCWTSGPASVATMTSVEYLLPEPQVKHVLAHRCASCLRLQTAETFKPVQ